MFVFDRDEFGREGVCFATPNIIKAKIEKRLKCYLGVDDAFPIKYLDSHAERVVDDMISGVQIPKIYESDSFFEFMEDADVVIRGCGMMRQFDPRNGFKACSFNGISLFETFVKGKDYDRLKMYIKSSEYGELLPTYDENKINKDIIKKLEIKSFGLFLREFGAFIPDKDGDIIIILDDTTKILIKSDSTLRRYVKESFDITDRKVEFFYPYKVLNAQRAFAITNGEIFKYWSDWTKFKFIKEKHCPNIYSDDATTSKSLVAQDIFYELTKESPFAEGNDSLKKSVARFIEKFYTVPDSCRVITLDELEKEFISSL